MSMNRLGAGAHSYEDAIASPNAPVWSRTDVSALPPPPHHHHHHHGSVPPISYSGAASPQHNTTIVHSSMKPVPDSDIYRVGIYGWRKRCLYVFILLLTIVIVINLAASFKKAACNPHRLTFSVDNLDYDCARLFNRMGALKITDDGIRVEGRSDFARSVRFSELSAPNDETLFIDSSSGVYVTAKNVSGQTSSSLNLSPDGKTTAVCQRFEVLDTDHKLLFFVDQEEVGLRLANLRVLDDGGSVFEGAIQTALVQPEPDTPLRLESPTRSLTVDAGQDIELLSGAGEIQLNALLDVNINSKQGDIHLDASNVYISNLERSSGAGNPQYQLCMCQSGRLFLANERADCRADRSICS